MTLIHTAIGRLAVQCAWRNLGLCTNLRDAVTSDVLDTIGRDNGENYNGLAEGEEVEFVDDAMAHVEAIIGKSDSKVASERIAVIEEQHKIVSCVSQYARLGLGFPGDTHFKVFVQATDRCFGGREEGGWYYDRTVTTETHHAWGFDNLVRILGYLTEQNPPNRHNRFSVLGGTDVTLRVQMAEEEDPQADSGRQTYE